MIRAKETGVFSGRVYKETANAVWLLVSKAIDDQWESLHRTNNTTYIDQSAQVTQGNARRTQTPGDAHERIGFRLICRIGNIPYSSSCNTD